MNKTEVIKKYQDKTKYDLCCSESIFYAARDYYGLDLEGDALKISAAFCGGNLTEDVCGLLTSSIAIIAVIFTENVSHQSPLMKSYVQEYTQLFINKYEAKQCPCLKKLYRDEVTGCKSFIIDAFEFLCDFIDSKKQLQNM